MNTKTIFFLILLGLLANLAGFQMRPSPAKADFEAYDNMLELRRVISTIADGTCANKKICGN